MGSDRDLSLLTTRRNRRFIQSAETYPVVKVRHARRRTSRRVRPKSLRRPAIRWSMACHTRGGHGSEARCGTRPVWEREISGDGTRSIRFASTGWRSDGGGDEETRTPDPLLAKEMLCQLSYVPAPVGGEWWAILDSNQRPLPYQGSALTS